MTEEIKITDNVIKEKKNNVKLVSWISGIIFVLLITVLIIVKVNNPNFGLKWVFILGGIFLLICGGIIILFNFANWTKKKDVTKNKDPEPITLKQAYERACEIIGSPKLADYIDNIIEEDVEEHGRIIKQKIYYLHCIGLYSNNRYFVVINMHYPETNYGFAINPIPAKMNYMKKKAATDPEENPDREVIERTNPLLGTSEKIIKTTAKKEKENDNQEKKEDLK